MVEVFLADVCGLPDPRESPTLMKELSPDRQARALRPVQPGDRRLLLGAGLLLDEIFSRFGARAEEIVVGKDGKPRHPDLLFSLSHSGEKVALAISRKGEVGCDLEKERAVPESVARRLPKEERQRLQQLVGEARAREFFRLWTMRESYLKMTGEGLLGFWKLEILPSGGILRDGVRQPCSLKEFSVAGYALSICAEEGVFGKLEAVALG